MSNSFALVTVLAALATVSPVHAYEARLTPAGASLIPVLQAHPAELADVGNYGHAIAVTHNLRGDEVTYQIFVGTCPDACLAKAVLEIVRGHAGPLLVDTLTVTPINEPFDPIGACGKLEDGTLAAVNELLHPPVADVHAVQQISLPGLRLLDALLDHPAERADVRRYGEVVAVGSEITETSGGFQIFVGKCKRTLGYVCAPKAILEINRGADARLGRYDNAVVVEVTSPFDLDTVRFKLNDATKALAEAILANPAAVKKFIALGGNKVVSATAQLLPNASAIYTITAENCHPGGVRCMGGASLRFTASAVRHGMETVIRYTTTLGRLR